MNDRFRALVDDTYAEAFRSIYAEVLITARDRTWLDHAVAAATGNASWWPSFATLPGAGSNLSKLPFQRAGFGPSR